MLSCSKSDIHDLGWLGNYIDQMIVGSRDASESAARIDCSHPGKLQLIDRIYEIVVILAVEIVEEMHRCFRMILADPRNFHSKGFEDRSDDCVIDKIIIHQKFSPFFPVMSMDPLQYLIDIIEILIGAWYSEDPVAKILDFIYCINRTIHIEIHVAVSDTHIRQHLLESGLGLRQIIDWLLCLKSLTEEETEQLQRFAEQTGLYTLACAINQICNHHFGTAFSWDERVDAETEESLLEHRFMRGNFGRKLGADRPVEAVSLSVREQGLFPYLQRMGRLHWKASEKYAVLRPFAWMHTVCRYAKKGTKMLLTRGGVQEQFSSALKINGLLHRLGLD